MNGVLNKLRLTLSLVKFSHTIFALPFALASGLLAWRALPAEAPREPWRWFGGILAAMVGARTAAMAFNRIVDLKFDRENPRAQSWPLVSGALTVPFAWGVFAASAALLAAAAAWLNPLALKLAPAALLIVCFYSLTKRFTALTHFFLGLALGVAPVGAWIAVSGRFAALPFALCGAVVCWVAGFDLMYHCQDVEIDAKLGLHSLPVALGIRASLVLSALLHVAMIALLALAGHLAGLGAAHAAGVALLAVILAWEHWIVRPGDLSRINTAFFTLNGWVAMLYLAAVAADGWLARH